jgi:hypothetical protein
MNFKLSFARTANQQMPARPVTEIGSMRCDSAEGPVPSSLTKYLGELGMEAIRKQKGGVRPRTKAVSPAETTLGFLGRAFSWLNGRCAPEKQLRVLETVTLGDKRMVAMIQADGRRFLVGGGPSGVSLLTPLDPCQKPLSEFATASGLRELAG